MAIGLVRFAKRAGERRGPWRDAQPRPLCAAWTVVLSAAFAGRLFASVPTLAAAVFISSSRP